MFLKIILPLFILSFLTSCFPAAKVPVDTLAYPYEKGIRQECLIVFLPGRGDRAGDFEREGFIDRLRKEGLKADAVAVDLHFGYYLNRVAAERLRHDVIVPARERGYGHLWLVGISIGGLAALEYERKYPGEISGIILLAPYLGSDEIADEINRTGGLRRWNPGLVSESDYERLLWAWIKRYDTEGLDSPLIYLGYGRDDRYAESDRLLESALGPGRALTLQGGHSWTTWKVLWNSLSARISCQAGPNDKK